MSNSDKRLLRGVWSKPCTTIFDFSFSSGDWLLRFLYRTLSVAMDGVAGLQQIEVNDKKMHNVDLTDLVTGKTTESILF